MNRLRKLALGLAWLALFAGILLVMSQPQASQAQALQTATSQIEPISTSSISASTPGVDAAAAIPRLYLPLLNYAGSVNNPITPVPTTPVQVTVLPPGTPTPTASPTASATATATASPTPTSSPTPTPTATPSPPAGCPDGMFSCWRFEENGGQTYSNSAAPLLPATCVLARCPAAVAGEVGIGLGFDGIDDGLTVASDPLYDWPGSASFSVELWVRTGQPCTGNKVFVGRGETGPSWWLGCSGSGNVASFFLRDSTGKTQSLRGNQAINDGAWRLLAAVRDAASDETRLYVDGELAATATTSFTGSFASTSDVNIGFLGSGFFFNGRLDEVALYSRPLPLADIRAHYFLARAYCQVCASQVRIMPLGDSITRGFLSTSMNGYRRRVDRNLTSAGYDVGFVGSLVDGATDFDRDHEGHGGWEADRTGSDQDIAGQVFNFLTANPADVVLLHIGTNDISVNGQSPSEVSAILDEIDRFNPDITVVLALIIDRRTHSAATSQYNDGLRAMAEDRIARGDKIIIVDMESALNYSVDMGDNLHPNDSGYNKMADVWLTALKSFLPVCP